MKARRFAANPEGQVPPPRSSLHRALIVATALVVAPISDVRAQDGGLRGGEDSGAFPTPSTAAAGTDAPSSTASPTDSDRTIPPATQQNADDPGAPNYGKPRKRKAKLYRPNPKTSPPLPALVPYRGAPGPQRRVLNPVAATSDAGDPQAPPPTIAVIPSPPQPRRIPEEAAPFAPTGVRAGMLRLLPFVETSTGYETNPNQVAAGVKPSAVLRVDGGLDVLSDFSNHSLTATLRAGYSDFPSNQTANRPDFNGVVKGRIDVTRNDTINLEGRFLVATQTPGSPQLAVPNSVFITNRPTIVSEGATLGGVHTFNRLAIDLRGTVDRTQYGDATQSDGSIFRYSEDNYNDYGVIGRASYELTPALIPFAELGFDSRVRDKAVDLSGFARDSVGGAARVGSSFEFARIFTGSASVGYAERHYADSRLPDLRGPTFEASLVYAVTPITTVTLRANTTLSETTLAGATGAISRSFGVELAHVFFQRFTVTGIATYQPNEYQGVSVNEAYTQFTLKGAYSVTRDVQLIASASRQSLRSSLVGSSFVDNVFLVGVRMQR